LILLLINQKPIRFLFIKEKRRAIDAHYPPKRMILSSFWNKMHICELLCLGILSGVKTCALDVQRKNGKKRKKTGKRTTGTTRSGRIMAKKKKKPKKKKEKE